MTTSVSEAELEALIAGLTTTASKSEPCTDPFCIGTPGGGCGRTPNEHLQHHGAAKLVDALKDPPVKPAPAAPVSVATRCTITDLLSDQCSHCRPAPTPAARRDDDLGAWFPAMYKGQCAGCGACFGEGERIRADGSGGWLAECCGHVDQADTTDGIVDGTPVARPVKFARARTPDGTPCGCPACDSPDDNTCMFGGDRQPGQHQELIQAPRPVKDGPPTSTITELRAVLIDFEASRPRSMQVALGPSELGTPCQQQMARKLAGAPRRPIVDPTWAPFQGTAVHASMENVVSYWNDRLGYERWLAEDRLVVDPGLPGDDGQLQDGIEGNGDAFDLDFGCVVDWKLVGKTALEKLRRGIRMNKPPAEQVSPEYRVQGHLYGVGHARKGRVVRYIRLVLLARSHDYDESAEWTEEFRPEIAHAALNRYWGTHDLLAALDVATDPDMIAAVPSAPSRDACKWCPFFRPGQPTDWQGCAGDQPLDKVVERATAGLIEP
jgi:hypothetical protein